MGMSHLNRNNPMVIIMEDEHSAAKKSLFLYTKYGVTSCLVCLIITFIISFITAGLYTSILLSLLIIGFFFSTIRQTVKSVHLKQVNNILFDADFVNYYANSEEVYNVTIQISKMNGYIIGKRSTITHLNTVIGCINIALIIIKIFSIIQ